MDSAEARRVLSVELAKYRHKPYRELVALIGTPHTTEVTAPSGEVYQIEFQAFWDDPGKQNVLRIAGAIDDGGLRVYTPLTDSFLVAPGGRFIGK